MSNTIFNNLNKYVKKEPEVIEFHWQIPPKTKKINNIHESLYAFLQVRKLDFLRNANF